MSDTIAVSVLSAAEAEAALPELVGVLRDAVDDGASVGFLPPFSDDDGMGYWRGVVGAVADGSRVLLVARRGDGPILGAVQLDLAQPC